jgi:NAD(P)-dependent dehydrogenase (short-subunit alcohol dehydrogenase family)
VTHQEFPGKEHKMPLQAQYDTLPTDEGGYQKYQAAGKLEGKKALITGGDSGIGRATAILFAMEGADSFIVYLPDEEKDAQETRRLVEGYGRKCYLHPTDLTSKDNCRKLVDEAVKAMGRVNILFNNAAYQMMKKDIHELSE